MTARVVLGHRISEIDYSRDYLECSCGAVMRADPWVGEWAIHRRSLGLEVKSVGQAIGKRLRSASIARPFNPGPIRAPVATTVRTCGRILRNRHGEWACAVVLRPGVHVHAGQHRPARQ